MIFVFDSKIIMSKNYLIAYGGRRGCEVLFLHYVPNVFHCFGSHLRRAVTFFYSIESRKCGVCRQRKSSGARRKTECSWWPCMKNWFSSWNSMLPWGQGWAFLPWNKPPGLLKGKNAHPCPKGCILLSEENQCWMQGNQVLKIFFDCKRAVSV